jgi:hypothetical protein
LSSPDAIALPDVLTSLLAAAHLRFGFLPSSIRRTVKALRRKYPGERDAELKARFIMAARILSKQLALSLVVVAGLATGASAQVWYQPLNFGSYSSYGYYSYGYPYPGPVPSYPYGAPTQPPYVLLPPGYGYGYGYYPYVPYYYYHYQPRFYGYYGYGGHYYPRYAYPYPYHYYRYYLHPRLRPPNRLGRRHQTPMQGRATIPRRPTTPGRG